MDGEPHPTIYINNINEKIKKDALKKLLYMLFSQYGKVKQVIACKGLKLRGQAWVVFDNVISASNALKGKQNFKLYGKELKLHYAKTKSHEVARKEGLEVVKSAPTTNQSRGSNKRARDTDNEDDNGEDTNQPPSKEAKLMTNNVPHKILVAQNLPGDITKEAIQAAFQIVTGVVDVRVVGGRGLAFVEFENETQSALALRQLNGTALSGTAHTIQLTFSN